MPPYRAVTSKAQSRKLFALAHRGELTGGMAEARGKTRAANFSKLPERKGSKRGQRRSFKRATAR